MMHNLEPQSLVASSRLFRDLLPHELATIIAQFQSVAYPQGRHIIERDVWHGHFYIVASGSVSVLLQEGDERSAGTVVARLGPGECFGEMSVITGEPPSATVRAEQDLLLWSLSQRDFMLLTVECPTLLRNINHILSQRLVRTNEQILSTPHAECVWLDVVHRPASPLEYSLVYHIAHALAERSRKRVLLLEMCEFDQAVGPRFSMYTDQVRPGILACIDSPGLLQRHKAPTSSAGGQYFPAVASLTDARTTDRQEGLSQAQSGWIVSPLNALATAYDYLLIVTTQTTPGYLVQVVESSCQRSIVLVSAHEESIRYAQQGLSVSQPGAPRSVFVAHVPERPTIGRQDRYATELGLEVEGEAIGQGSTHLARLLPADTPLLERCWAQQAALSMQEPAAALTKAVDFVARHIARQTVGVAFGGGGARGFAHLGILRRLLESNVPLDYVSACSIGTLAVGLHLIGTSLSEIEEIFLEIHRLVGRWNIPRTSLFSSKRLKRRFMEVCEERRFEDLLTPFAVVAVDLATQTGVVLDRGLLWPAGLASVAIPGIFPPVMIGGHVLVDAGMHDPVPVGVLRRMGADVLVASELSVDRLITYQSATPWLEEAGSSSRMQKVHTPHIVDLLLRSYDVAMATISMYSIREADVTIRPKLHNVSLRQFSQGHKFVMAGYEATEEALPALRERLPWLRIS